MRLDRVSWRTNACACDERDGTEVQCDGSDGRRRVTRAFFYWCNNHGAVLGMGCGCFFFCYGTKEDSSVTKHINKTNSILARLISVGIKFDDEVQAYYCYCLCLTVGPERLQQLQVQRDLMDSLLRRFVISFLARISEEGVLGNYLVNRYMSSEVRKISEIVGARTKE